MIVRKNEIILLKAQGEGDDKFEPLLTKNGFSVKYLQVLEFVFVDLPVLTEKLKHVEDYSGLIFTSPRAVTATKLSLNGDKIDDRWLCKNNFVVGETTFTLVEKELGMFCEGKESGNANNLANVIIQGNFTKPFLFPCGNLKKETLQHRLKEKNIELDPVTVYETKRNQNLNDDFAKLTLGFTSIPEYILFFSPSGVSFTEQMFKKLPIDKLKLIAIGPSTEKALQDANLPVYSVAAKPTDVEVLNAVKA